MVRRFFVRRCVSLTSVYQAEYSDGIHCPYAIGISCVTTRYSKRYVTGRKSKIANAATAMMRGRDDSAGVTMDITAHDTTPRSHANANVRCSSQTPSRIDQGSLVIKPAMQTQATIAKTYPRIGVLACRVSVAGAALEGSNGSIGRSKQAILNPTNATDDPAAAFRL